MHVPHRYLEIPYQRHSYSFQDFQFVHFLPNESTATRSHAIVSANVAESLLSSERPDDLLLMPGTVDSNFFSLEAAGENS